MLNIQHFDHRGFDPVLALVVGVGIVALIWFSIRAYARRGHPRFIALYNACDPWLTASKTWVTRSPATLVYMSCWTATTMLVEGSPKNLVDIFTRFNSTNIFGIVTEPIRSLIVSALLVADNGSYFMFYVVSFVLIVARLEHRLGTPRTVMVWLFAHVGGSLMTVGCEVVLLRLHFAQEQLKVTSDVGVSYVMVGSFGAYLFLVSKRMRWWYVGTLFVGIVLPCLVFQQLWNFGHLFATLFGVLAGWIALRMGPTRPRLWWRDLIAKPPDPLGEPSHLKPVDTH